MHHSQPLAEVNSDGTDGVKLNTRREGGTRTGGGINGISSFKEDEIRNSMGWGVGAG